MMANTAGSLPIIIRAGIGVGGMRPMIIVVHSVPGVVFTIRVMMFVLPTPIIIPGFGDHPIPNTCGPECPPPPPNTYDPSRDYCYHDNDNPWKYCWFPFNSISADRLPDGNWKMDGDHGLNDCGDPCTDFAGDAHFADDNKCVAASGPWPAGSYSQIKDCQHDENGSCGPYVTCFQFAGSDKQCWSHSYYNNGDWDPCKPYPYTTFGGGWEFDSPKTARVIQYPKRNEVPGITVYTLEPMDSCGTACTEFDPDVPH